MRARMRWLVAVAAGLAVAVGAIAASPSPAEAETDGARRIMPLGDSITEGIDVPGGYREGLWRRLAASRYHNDLVGSQANRSSGLGDPDHEGHPRWRIDQIDAKVVDWLEATTPDSVLLHIGTNDMGPDYAAGAPARLSTLIDHITDTVPDAEVFVATITPLGWANGDAAVRAFNRKIPAMVKRKARNGQRVHLVDMYSALKQSDLADDGVHPNARGYDKMAAVWYRALRSVPGALEDPTTPPWVRNRARAQPTVPVSPTPTPIPTPTTTTAPVTGQSTAGLWPAGASAASAALPVRTPRSARIADRGTTS
jgi:lysophospholipase L1-like esterase